MVSQTTYYGKLLRPDIQGGRKVTVLCGKARFKSSANVCTIGVPFLGDKKTSSVILGFSYGWHKKPTSKAGLILQTSGVMHCSAVTMSGGAIATYGMGQSLTFPKNIRVSRTTGHTSASSFWYKVIGW